MSTSKSYLVGVGVGAAVDPSLIVWSVRVLGNWERTTQYGMLEVMF